MLPTVRHQTAPVPFSCRWCGLGNLGHGRRSVPGHPRHEWTEPTRAQVNARLDARHAQPRTFRRLGDRVPNA